MDGSLSSRPRRRHGNGPTARAVGHAPARPAPHRGDHTARHTRETPLAREHATIVAFDATRYTATITLARSPDVALPNVPVSRAIPAALLVPGATAAVLFFDRYDPADAMIVGVH